MNNFARFGLVLLAMNMWSASALAESEPPAPTETTEAAQLPDMALGSQDAPITIIEYASLTCPHCSAWAGNEFKVMKTDYIDTGKVHFIYRQFPTAPMQLAIAGEAVARCKGDAKSYFEMIDALYASQPLWEMARNPGAIIRQVAQNHDISSDEFDKCVANEAIAKHVQATTLAAEQKWGIRGTPSFVINGKFYPRIYTMEQFRQILDPLLAGDRHSPTETESGQE